MARAAGSARYQGLHWQLAGGIAELLLFSCGKPGLEPGLSGWYGPTWDRTLTSVPQGPLLLVRTMGLS